MNTGIGVNSPEKELHVYPPETFFILGGCCCGNCSSWRDKVLHTNFEGELCHVGKCTLTDCIVDIDDLCDDFQYKTVAVEPGGRVGIGA